MWSVHLGQRSHLFSKWYWERKRINLEYLFTVCAKTNVKQIKDPNIKHETRKLLEENIDMFSDILSTFKKSSQAKKTIAKINKWDYIELKSFHRVKETINKTKRQPTE